MRDPFRTLHWLEAILTDPSLALTIRKERSSGRALRDFREDHLPYFFGYAALILFSPYLWYRVFSSDSTSLIQVMLSSLKGFLMPPVFVLLFLIFVGLYDRFTENRFSPTMKRAISIDPDQHNRALFLAIPVSASLLFFVLHPLAGYLMLLASALYSLAQTVHFQALHENSSLRRTAAMLAAFAGVFLFPLLALLLVYNILLTARILIDLF